MLVLLLDMFALWLLLNIFTEENWDDEKLKIFFMALAISLLGGIATVALVDQLGLLSLGVYLAIGIVILWALASIPIRQASIVMSIFLVYKVGVSLAWTALFTSA